MSRLSQPHSIGALTRRPATGRDYRRYIAAVLTLMAAWLLAPASGLAAGRVAIDTQAREAFMIDYETGAVLFDLRGDVRMPPASMSKIMTAYLVFERIADGRLRLNEPLTTSARASAMEGSKMFLRAGQRATVDELLRGLIVQSGNDAAVTLAEAISGSEQAFAAEMNARGAELGLSGSRFTNATGLPDPSHFMTARDLAILSRALIARFPEQYRIYSEPEYTFARIRQSNRNPLLGKFEGADGIKTGHTEEAGYGLVSSAVRDGRRLILVVSGLPSMKARGEESARILDWGFREFGNYTFYEAGETVTTADVWLGTTAEIPLVASRTVRVTLPVHALKSLKAVARFSNPIVPPVAVGEAVTWMENGQPQTASLIISGPGINTLEFPLVAGQGASQLGPVNRIVAAAEYLIFGTPRP